MTRIIEPGTLETPAGSLPVIRLAGRDVFRTRAARLRALAEGHALGDYLRFLSALAGAQDEALAVMHHVALPDARLLAQAREHGMPPLAANSLARDPVWRAALASILNSLSTVPMPDASRAVIERLQAADAETLERLADSTVSGDPAKLDRAAAPFIAAALQVYWLHLVTRLGVEAFAPLPGTHAVCPCCGSAPVASVVRIGGEEQGLRYLTCSLCQSQWHVVRIKCAFCDTTKDISYYEIEGGNAAVKAEQCASCGSYLKILYMEKDPNLDAVADDVASIALDVLMAESGMARGGVNYYLIGGDA